MVTTTRVQRRYDHRLRELVRTAQDMRFALQHGVPRSTARGWLAAAAVEVVSTDVLNMDEAHLQQKVIRLRTRVQKLIALLRIAPDPRRTGPAARIAPAHRFFPGR